MIPQEKNSAVTLALREAFGVSEFEDIREMTKGQTTAGVFRIVVKGSSFLLRIAPSGRAIGPERQFTCMSAAAKAGVAPRVWYTNVDDGIAITDLVEEVPFPAADALVRMPDVLRKLHALPPFPKPVEQFDTSCMFLMRPGPVVDGFKQKFRAANILPEDECEELLSWHGQVCDAYQWREEDFVSSHNDLFKPDNVLFDGERVWLVDWEAAFLNDRYADLAVVANLIVADGAEESTFLAQYFGHAPTDYQRARFFVMQQITHMFYSMVYLLIGSAGESVDFSGAVPAFQEFQRRFWSGEIRLDNKETKILYARVHWSQLVQNMRDPARFQEASRIIGSASSSRRYSTV